MKKTFFGLIIIVLFSICPFYCTSATELAFTESVAEWTFMVYMDADNDLEKSGISDFMEMASVGSDDNIKIVVQFDRIKGETGSFGDWTDCQRFLVSKDMKPAPYNAISDWGDGYGGREVNMADPRVLTDFIEWGRISYPANHYAVILWNHGGGWRNAESIEPRGIKAICWDETSGIDESMEMKEVKQAFTAAGWVDLIGFDACLMGMVEVAYEIRNLGEIMVGSEESEPEAGWPYHMLLADLTASPLMTPAELGSTIVADYGEANESYSFFGGTTQSAIDLSMIDSLADSINVFASELIDSDRSDVFTARRDSLEFDYSEHIDLYQFAEFISDTAFDYDLQTAASNVLISIENSVIANFCDSFFTTATGAHGLAVYFPKNQFLFDKDYNGSIIDFSEDTEWDEFLGWFYTGNTGQPIPVNLISPGDEALLPADSSGMFSWETNSEYRYKLEFSSSAEFARNVFVLSIPRTRWMQCTTTDDIPESVWECKWESIKRIEQINGIVYWRVVGKGRPPSVFEISETRSFTLFN